MDLQKSETIVSTMQRMSTKILLVDEYPIKKVENTNNEAAILPKLPNYESVPFRMNRAQKRYLKYEASRIKNPTWDIHQEKKRIKRRVKKRIQADSRKINQQNF